jgi:photosystem II stability/assembly factor-like uncharacterized protein
MASKKRHKYFSSYWIIGICFSIMLCCSAFCEASYTKNQWHSTGPWSGDRFNVIIDPIDNHKLYVIGGAIHKSADGGEHWKAITNTSVQTRGLYAYSMAINPQNTDEMYAGTLFEGVWKSSNVGAIWEPVNNSLPDTDRSIRSLIMDIADPQTLYLGILNTSGNAQAGLYKSADGGSTWTPFDVGIPKPFTEATCIFQNPLNYDLFAGTYGDGIYKYSYVEEKWIAVNSGLNLPLGMFVTYITFDPFDELVIYACTQKDWVYKSADGGETWQQMAYPEQLYADYPPMAYYVNIDPNNSNVIWIGSLPGSNWPNESPFYQAEPNQDLGGLFLSTDNGVSWQKVLQEYGGFRLTIDPSETVGDYPDIKSKVLYLTSGSIMGVLKSEDGGKSFQRKIEGMNGSWTNGLLQHSMDRSKIFACSEEGIFFTFDGGATWSIFGPAPNGRAIYTWSMAIDPTDSSRLYYAMGDPAWAWPENKGLYVIDISELDPTEDINYVSGEQVTSTKGIGIWKVYPFENSTIYLATQDRGILKSENHGQSWNELNDGLGEMSVTCIAFDEDGAPLYAGTRTSDGNPNWFPELAESGALYKWMAESDQWSRIGGSEITTAVFDIVTLTKDQDTIYTGTVDGLFLSNDGGTTWAKKNYGLPELLFVSDIEIDPNNNRRIFLSSWYNGVHVSVDGGDHWDAFNEKLTHLFVQDIVIDWMEPDILYAGTLGGSVFQCVTGNEPVIDSIVGNESNLIEPYSISVNEMGPVEITVNAHDPDPEDSLTYAAYYNGMKIPAPWEVENPDSTYTFDRNSRRFQWTPTYGMAREEPHTILFAVSDGVFSVCTEVDIIVEPGEAVYAPTIELTINQNVYHPDDWMDLTASVSNFYSPCEVDIYLALETESNPYLRYFSCLTGVTLPYGLNIENIPLVHYQLIDIPAGTYIWSGIIVPSGADMANKDIWLNSDPTISFTFYE